MPFDQGEEPDLAAIADQVVLATGPGGLRRHAPLHEAHGYPEACSTASPRQKGLSVLHSISAVIFLGLVFLALVLVHHRPAVVFTGIVGVLFGFALATSSLAPAIDNVLCVILSALENLSR
ncbi:MULTISPECIES: hypothetical protein [unclassified Kitasatospora]|uniref:hypothetical protein n=1 Tax=unclassified Kitasatospora TaxID=2633591 RepID=UPI0038183683